VNTWLLLIVMTLAVYRITRLVTRDDFPPVLWLRDRLAGGWRPLSLKEQETKRLPVMDHDGQSATVTGLGAVQQIDGQLHRYVNRSKRSPYWLAELVSCPWCVSGWIAGALTLAVALTVGVPAPLLVWPAVWGAAALLAARDWA
jgi:hypothetical protein